MAKSKRKAAAARSPAPPVARRPPVPPPSLGSLTWPRDAIFSAGLALLIAVAYWPLAGNGFTNYDDDGYVVENEFVNQGLSVNSIRWAMTTLREANWHPLTWLSHMLDCQWFGLRPSGHHLVSLGLHAINSMLLYCVLLRMTRAVWPSLVVAAFFAVHPLHVESVAWVAERKDVLSTMFGLVALWAWLSYLARPSLIRYAAVMLAFAASLMSKPMLVTLPFVLLLLDYWPLGRGLGARGWGLEAPDVASAPAPSPQPLAPPPRPPSTSLTRLLVEKLPLLLMSAASCIVTLIAQSRGYAVTPLAGYSIAARLATVMRAYCGYLGKMAVPMNLAPIYPLPRTVHYPAAIACGIALLLATVVFMLAGRARKYLVVGWLWYLGMLVPVIGIVQVGRQSMADRYSYLPLVGVMVLVAWSGAEALSRRPRLKGPLAGLTVAGLVACCLLTSAQVRRWASTKTLFAYTAEVTEDNPVALTNLGLVAIHEEDYAEAERQLRAALRLDPANIDALGNLATMHVQQKNFDAAIQEYGKIAKLCPNYFKVYSEMARALHEQGNHPQEDACLRRAVELEPASPSLRQRLALVQQMLGKTQDALENYAAVLRLQPGDGEALNNVAWIRATHPLAQFRDGPQAVDLLRPLAAKADCDPNLLDTLAAAYAEAGRWDDARQTVETAIDKARREQDPHVSIADMEQRAALYQEHLPYRDQLLAQAESVEADARKRRLVLGTWRVELQGKRTMTLNEDGTGTMLVELSGWQAALSASRLKFNIKWSVEGSRLKKQTIGGEPQAQVKVILSTMGDRVDEPILELTADRLLLLDKDGKTKYDWKRVKAGESAGDH